MGVLITIETNILIFISLGVVKCEQPIYMSVFEIAGICLIFILAISGCICYCRERLQNYRSRRNNLTVNNRNEVNCNCSPNCNCNRVDYNISRTTAPPPYNRVVPQQQDNFLFQSSNNNLELNYITTKVDELPTYANVIGKKISIE